MAVGRSVLQPSRVSHTDAEKLREGGHDPASRTDDLCVPGGGEDHRASRENKAPGIERTIPVSRLPDLNHGTGGVGVGGPYLLYVISICARISLRLLP